MNNWNLKISELPNQKGFTISVENNGEVVMTPNVAYRTFDKAVDDAQKIVRNRIAFYDVRNKRALETNNLFIKKFISSKHYNGIYNSLVKVDSKNNPYLEVTMNTDNENLVKLVPNVITDPKTRIDYKIVKVKPVGNVNPNVAV